MQQPKKPRVLHPPRPPTPELRVPIYILFIDYIEIKLKFPIPDLLRARKVHSPPREVTQLVQCEVEVPVVGCDVFIDLQDAEVGGRPRKL